ncbi:MAG: hypothetical protein ACT4QD_15000 [Acidobacteriota bacterium]
MAEDRASASESGGLPLLFHRLNNQLGVILAHAELLEAKAPDHTQRDRATHIVGAALEAMAVARTLRESIKD